MRGLTILAVLFGLAAVPAGAQTMLTIGASGQADVAPDEATATLIVQASSPNAAEAQAEVDALMRKALAAARALPGVVATTGSFETSQQHPDTDLHQTLYQASQALNLVLPAADGVPPAPFTDLLGKLQQQGLLLNDLGGGLSSTARAAAQQAAVLAGLAQIQAQAAAVAAQLHERVGAVKTLNVNAQPAPERGPMMPLAMRADAAAPVSVPGLMTVTAEITAEVELDAAKGELLR